MNDERSLSRKRLLSAIGTQLFDDGYRVVPGKTIGAAGLLFKSVDDLILSLGIEVSRTYTALFSASFYLSKSFTWAYLPKWFPRNAYARVGRFLTDKERAELLSERYTEPGVVDAWWPMTVFGVHQFTAAVRVAENRFVHQPDMIMALKNSSELQAYVDLLDRIRVSAGSLPADEMTDAWRTATATVLHESGDENPKPQFIELLAIDAWRRATLV